METRNKCHMLGALKEAKMRDWEAIGLEAVSDLLRAQPNLKATYKHKVKDVRENFAQFVRSIRETEEMQCIVDHLPADEELANGIAKTSSELSGGS